MHSYGIWILFAVIKKKRAKHSMACETVQIRWGCFLVCDTEVLQSKYFNRQKPITNKVFRLDLVYKSGYYTFYIITTAQNILKAWVDFECLLERVATVMRSNNVDMW